MTLLIAFLSLALAVAALIVIRERRQRRGLESLLNRVLHRESFYADAFENHRTDPADTLDSWLRSKRPQRQPR